MITYNINNRPEEIFITPTLISGENFIVFNSNEEWDEYINNIPIIWSKENHKQELTSKIQEYVDSVAVEHWYSNMAEVPTCNVVGGEWEVEAKSLLLWNSKIWFDFQTYLTTVTEQNAKTAQQYVFDIESYDNFII